MFWNWNNRYRYTYTVYKTNPVNYQRQNKFPFKQENFCESNFLWWYLVNCLSLCRYVDDVDCWNMTKIRIIHESIQKASLRWRHNDHDSVSNHQPHGCLFNRLFRRRSKKTSKLRVTGLCLGNSPGSVNSPHKGPVTRKMFPFDDVIMILFHIWMVAVIRRVVGIKFGYQIILFEENIKSDCYTQFARVAIL